MAGRKSQSSGRGVGTAGAPGAANRAVDAHAASASDVSSVNPDLGDARKTASASETVEVEAVDAAAADTTAVDAALGDLGQAEEALVEELEEELDPLSQARAEADEFRDRFVRLQAEWDNFRRRTASERTQERIRAAEGLVERLLPIVDDLERAIEHSDTANEASLKEGIAAVYNKLVEVLEREGVKVIDPTGEAFDANLHQAVGKAEDASVPDETVVQLYQKGYQMGDRVLRSAMVVVSQGGPKRDAES
ncbi:MAG: nucleotide exchange factor GrpE [Coriobacteriales bacterium]|jgi:molecular chaperone GrpE|nr:nucleotide exchange factor GrpE [Coriobacteriales bacterium]